VMGKLHLPQSLRAPITFFVLAVLGILIVLILASLSKRQIEEHYQETVRSVILTNTLVRAGLGGDRGLTARAEATATAQAPIVPVVPSQPSEPQPPTQPKPKG